MTEVSSTITITVNGGASRQVPALTKVDELLESSTDDRGLHYLGALVNNDVVSLSFPLEVDSDIQFLTISDHHGWRIYRRSMTFLLAKGVKELFPKARFSVEHSLGTGFYCNFDQNGTPGISEQDLSKLEARIREMVENNLPIVRSKINYTTAMDLFKAEEQPDKHHLLSFRNPPKVVVYSCEGFSDLAHGPLTYSTGAVGHFRLLMHEPGFVIQFPDRDNAPTIPEFESQPHLFKIFQEHKEWGRITGVRTVGDLNARGVQRTIQDFIRVAEGFQEKKIARLADKISSTDKVRCVLIAGPSSSGKTTFAKRLTVQLRVNGLKPVVLSTDDYFVDRDRTPRQEDGSFDFEHLETIDLELFNDHLVRLFAGEEVEIPRFNFQKGEKEYKGNFLKLKHDEVLIIEGIHGLNPRLTEAVPAEQKFKIYISALTQLNLDFNNRISTTDNRLIRRIVRDNSYRGHSAQKTIEMWPSVRRGEKSWIFPFQKEADAAFNSALDYELAVLKPFVEPVLQEVKPDQPQYAEARRLLDFMRSFRFIPADMVPPNSLLREFIGDSTFRY